MKLYVGITDGDWFRFLRARNAEEMNFWRPRSTTNFGAINPGELFLFKTHYPENRIVGGAYFVRHTTLPLDLAWEVFKEANGVESLDALRRKMSSIRGDNERNPTIGCTVLTQPFYFKDEEFLSAPSDWGRSIVMGKSYDVQSGEGARLWEDVRLALAGRPSGRRQFQINPIDTAIRNFLRRDWDREVFELLSWKAIDVVVQLPAKKPCPFWKQHTSVHIQTTGPHAISNGIFLRSDIHTLFDRGYITITNEYRVEVSRRIRDEFSNGRDYYQLFMARNCKSRLNPPQNVLPENFWNGTKITAFSAHKVKMSVVALTHFSPARFDFAYLLPVILDKGFKEEL